MNRSRISPPLVSRPFVSRPDVRNSPPDAEFGVFHGAALEEQPIWTALCENIRDALFPNKLPPLELTSKPISAPDRMAVKTNPWAVGSSTILNGLILMLLVILGMRAAINQIPKPASGAPIDLSDFRVFTPATVSGNGGSGGSNDVVAPIGGRNPKFESMPLAPSMVSVVQQPKLAVDPAINIALPDNSSMPNIGVHDSPNVSLASNGPGLHAGIGTGPGGGVGLGSGPGDGPGADGGVVYSPGRGVVPPVPIYAPEAEFSDEARRSKYQGVCLISIIVDAHGNPQNPRVVQRLGMGLDEKAIEAILRYKFKPGTKDGKPVPVLITIEVDFRMF
jgi:periplasmic protein TonB